MSNQDIMSTPTRNLLEVLPDSYLLVKDRAANSGQSLKQFTSLLLEYAVQKLDAGQVVLTAPNLVEPKTARKGGNMRKGEAV